MYNPPECSSCFSKLWYLECHERIVKVSALVSVPSTEPSFVPILEKPDTTWVEFICPRCHKILFTNKKEAVDFIRR